jgi:polyphenol oxidase
MSLAGAWLAAEWPAPAAIRAGTTLRGEAGTGASAAPFHHLNLGAHCGDDPAAVAGNRARVRSLLSLPQEPRWLRQVHGTGVLRVDANSEATIAADDDGRPEADAAVTYAAGVVLAILTADCLPVLFCAADGSEIGAAHAGWRGLAAGALEATVAAMQTPADRLLAWLGPAAGPQHYEVGIDVHEAFVAADGAAAAAFVATRPGHWHVDLFALARRRLARAGVERVYGGGLCTLSDPRRFYSHRRDGRSGRMASLIWIDP